MIEATRYKNNEGPDCIVQYTDESGHPYRLTPNKEDEDIGYIYEREVDAGRFEIAGAMVMDEAMLIRKMLIDLQWAFSWMATCASSYGEAENINRTELANRAAGYGWESKAHWSGSSSYEGTEFVPIGTAEETPA